MDSYYEEYHNIARHKAAVLVQETCNQFGNSNEVVNLANFVIVPVLSIDQLFKK
jgi:hypothetical protein